MATEFVLACFRSGRSPTMWNFYRSLEEAQAQAATVSAKEGETYEPMTWAEYAQRERQHILSAAPVEITAERFYDMLDCLPPMNWEHHGTWQRFLMSEFETGPYTAQYMQVGDRYFQKIVHHKDRSTWMSPETCGVTAAKGE